MTKDGEIEWSKAQAIVVSLDLVKAAKQHLKFLEVIDNIRCLHDGPILNHAIYRYENCWLPLLVKHFESWPLVVPLDCEWIWHCHRLNPLQYKNDCQGVYGRLLDNKNVFSSTIEGICTKKSEKFWNDMYPTEPYHFDQNPHSMVIADCAKTIPYDLVAAVRRQSPFFKKMSKTIVNEDGYLREAVARYKAFLHIVKINEDNSVPTYDIDLMWHTHQLHPLAYYEDLMPIYGEILEHDDHIFEDPKDNQRKVEMDHLADLWENAFGRKYLTTGVMSTRAPCYCIRGVGKHDEVQKVDDQVARAPCYCIRGVKKNDEVQKIDDQVAGAPCYCIRGVKKNEELHKVDGQLAGAPCYCIRGVKKIDDKAQKAFVVCAK